MNPILQPSIQFLFAGAGIFLTALVILALVVKIYDHFH